MKQKHRLILINGRFMTQPITGVQRYAREVISALARSERVDFRFIIAVPDSNVSEPIPDIEIFSDNSSLPTAIWQQVRLPVLMKKLKADMLWSPCNIGPLYINNHVVSIYDTATFTGPKWFSKKFRIYYKTVFPILGQMAKKVITPSNFSKEELIKHAIAVSEKISVIPGGVGPKFKYTDSRFLDFSYVLTLGSRDPRKNISKLIESWIHLPADVKKNRKLVIAGREVHSFSSEGFKDIPDDVFFTGYIADKDLPSLYSGADIFVFPSLYEGFGLPPLEAMACECPVIASNTASLPEVCGDSAHYVDPYSVESITEGMNKVLTDDRLKQGLIKKGLERVKFFSWRETAEEHLRIFKEVLNN